MEDEARLAARPRAACRSARPCAGAASRRRRRRYSSSTSITTSSIGSSRSPVVGSVGTARAAGRSTARSPRGAWSRSARRAAVRRGRRPRRRPRPRSRATRIATLPSASRSSRSRIMRAGDLVALAAGERAVVDREGHGEGRRIDRLRRQRRLDRRLADACRRRWSRQARRWRRCRRPRPRSTGTRSRPRKASSLVMRRAARPPCRRAISALTGMLTAAVPGLDAAGQHAAEIGVVLQRRHQHRERRRRRFDRSARGTCVDDQVEQRRQVLARVLQVSHRPALRGRRRRGSGSRAARRWRRARRTGRRSRRAPRAARVRAVDLVDDDDRPQARAQRLAEHELGLRHRAFGGVDQQHARRRPWTGCARPRRRNRRGPACRRC